MEKIKIDLSDEEVFREFLNAYCREKGYKDVNYNFDVLVKDDKKYVGEITLTIKEKD